MKIRPTVVLVLGTLLGGAVGSQASIPRGDESEDEGRRLYMNSCRACHGADGRGAPPAMVPFELELPDFTDCRFTAREADLDWAATVNDGGPARGFDRMMPAFGSALDEGEIESILGYIRTLCTNRAWPRGELNLPRPLVTEKAFPEDEAVLTSRVDAESKGSIVNILTYERRLGARTQWEISLPYQTQRGNGTSSAFADVSAGVKHVLLQSLERGSILSVTGEMILPSGDAERGFGKGTPVFEPFVTYGQLLPADGFLQLQGGIEIPFDEAKAGREVFGRAVLGVSFTSDRFGRTWSPMVEILGARELESGARVLWDIVPQVQVTLNARQHIRVDVGVQIPVDNTPGRPTRVLVYLLWDWFDGGVFEGW